MPPVGSVPPPPMLDASSGPAGPLPCLGVANTDRPSPQRRRDALERGSFATEVRCGPAETPARVEARDAAGGHLVEPTVGHGVAAPRSSGWGRASRRCPGAPTSLRLGRGLPPPTQHKTHRCVGSRRAPARTSGSPTTGCPPPRAGARRAGSGTRRGGLRPRSRRRPRRSSAVVAPTPTLPARQLPPRRSEGQGRGEPARAARRSASTTRPDPQGQPTRPGHLGAGPRATVGAGRSGWGGATDRSVVHSARTSEDGGGAEITSGGCCNG